MNKELDKIAFVKRAIAEINERSVQTPFGKLQDLRKSLNASDRRASSAPFDDRTAFNTYAFHYGGRTELQFNIGFDREGFFRHGVAFSFELSQTLPTIGVLIPKVQRFNEYLRVNRDTFQDMLMWHWKKAERSPSEQRPAPIPSELIQEHIFVHMGKLQPENAVDFDLIVTDLNRLLSIYEFTQGTLSYPSEVQSQPADGLRFRAGNREKPDVANIARGKADVLNVDLRHNQIQSALYMFLARQHGEENVGTEITCPGGRVDVVVKNGFLQFYEIKTGLSARACIGEAIAQLLEYSYWPGCDRAEELIIVGEPKADTQAEAYLAELRSVFKMPIRYLAFDMDHGCPYSDEHTS